MSNDSAAFRQATESDLPLIASIHLQAYSKNHFTSRLPSGVLVNYYRLFLSDGAETLLLLDDAGEDGGETVGFAVFGRGIEAKIARFKRENRAAILTASIRHPLAAAGKVLRRSMVKLDRRRPAEPAGYLLLSIAVSRPGKGAGGHLLDAFVDRARQSGAGRAGLYVNADNIGAINAYMTRGFLVRELYGGQFYMERSL